MAWQELGTINLSYDWQFLAMPSGNYQLIRVTQLYNDADFINGKIVIAQAFNEPKEFFDYAAIYPSRNQKILRFLPPFELTSGDDVLDRFLGFKFDPRYYRYSIGWQIQIELQDIVPVTLNEIKALTVLNRGEIALIQTQLDRIEQEVNTPDGQ